MSVTEHAEMLGHVAITWNSAQESVYHIFIALMGMKVKEAESIFFTLKADSAQRDITLNLGKVVLASHPDLYKRLADLISKLNNLAGERNAALHSMWRVTLNKPTKLSPTAKPHGSLREDFGMQFTKLAFELCVLAGLLETIYDDIRNALSLPDILPPLNPQLEDTH